MKTFNLNYNITVELTTRGMRTWEAYRLNEKARELINTKYKTYLGFELDGNKLTGKAWEIFGIFGEDLRQLQRPFNMNIELHPMKSDEAIQHPSQYFAENVA